MKSHALSYLVGVVEENEIEAPEALSEAAGASVDRERDQSRRSPAPTRATTAAIRAAHLHYAEVRTSIKSGSDGGLSRTLPPDCDIEVWAEPPQAAGQ